MLVLTIALGVLLTHLFPIANTIFLATGTFVGSGLPPGPQRYLTLLINYGPTLLVAWWLLRRLTAYSYLAHMPRGRRLARIGLIIYAAYFVLALSGLILSAIPYGGGSVPKILHFIPVIANGFMFAGLAVALCMELPNARVAEVRRGR